MSSIVKWLQRVGAPSNVVQYVEQRGHWTPEALVSGAQNYMFLSGLITMLYVFHEDPQVQRKYGPYSDACQRLEYSALFAIRDVLQNALPEGLKDRLNDMHFIEDNREYVDRFEGLYEDFIEGDNAPEPVNTLLKMFLRVRQALDPVVTGQVYLEMLRVYEEMSRPETPEQQKHSGLAFQRWAIIDEIVREQEVRHCHTIRRLFPDLAKDWTALMEQPDET